MQAKDIEVGPLLAFIEETQQRKGMWVYTWDFDGTMYADLPPNLFRAKMSNLIKRGLITGCDCGCRGDFELTERGREYVRDLSQGH